MFFTAISMLAAATAVGLWVTGVAPWWLAASVLAAACGTLMDCAEYDGDDDL